MKTYPFLLFAFACIFGTTGILGASETQNNLRLYHLGAKGLLLTIAHKVESSAFPYVTQYC